MSESVRRYIAEGWSVIPIPKGEKGPRVANWQNTTFTEDQFGADDNIGVRLGEPSGGLTDVDLDSPEAIRAAASLLLTTGRIHGRPSKQQSHYWYIAEGVKAEQFKDTDGSVLVELRSDGGQTVLPPSFHPSGEQLAWETDREPGRVDGAGLRASVLQVATVALLARHWPTGARHVCAGLAAGFLSARGLDPATVERIVRLAATIAGDNEVEDRARYARDTADKFAKVDIKVAGGPKIAEHLGEGVLKKLREWYGVGQDNLIDEMNAKHFVITIGKDELIGTVRDGETIFQSPAALRIRYANQKVKSGKRAGKPKKNGEETEVDTYKSKFDIWLEHPGRLDYRTITFAPPPVVPHPKDFNLWSGFTIDPQPGCCDRLLYHIRAVICSGNEEHYEYLMDLLALGVQQPGVRSEIATILRGPQGAGKGIFIRAYGEIFGDHFAHLDKPEQLVGKFNSHLSGKVVVFADEAFFAGDRSIDGALKRLITEPTIQIERKGIDQYNERNCIHLFMATNREWAVGSEFNERRHFVLDVAPDYQQDHAYFAALVSEIESGGQAAFLDTLLKRAVDRQRLRKAPDTMALRDQQNFSLGTEHKWWKGCLTLGEVFENEGWPDWIASSYLYQVYIRWCDTMKINRRVTNVEMGKRVQKLLGGSHSDRRNTESRDIFLRPEGTLKRVLRGYPVPSLENARSIFDEVVLGPGKSGTWPTPSGDSQLETPRDEEKPEEDVPF